MPRLAESGRKEPHGHLAAEREARRQAGPNTLQNRPASSVRPDSAGQQLPYLRREGDRPGSACRTSGVPSREDFYNNHRPRRCLSQAAPLRPLPDGVTNLDHFRVRRRDRAGGVIHEYRLVA